jgi:hypothetical protein
MKKKSKPEKSKAQFARTIEKNQKWRGKKPADYVKVKSGKKRHQKLMPGQPDIIKT